MNSGSSRLTGGMIAVILGLAICPPLLGGASAITFYDIGSYDACNALPVFSGNVKWLGGPAQTCVINGIVSIPDDGISYLTGEKLAISSTGVLYVSKIHGSALINNGTLYVRDVEIVGGSAKVTNRGTMFIDGDFELHGALTNYGVIRNSGSLGGSSPIFTNGTIYNHGSLIFGFSKNNGTINNFANMLVGNNPTNNGLLNNAGTIEIESGETFTNPGTIMNCGGTFTGLGTVLGNAAVDGPCDIVQYHALKIGSRYGDPPTRVFPLNTEPAVEFEADDPTQTSVILRWLDPIGNVAAEKITPLLFHRGTNSSLLDQAGVWTVEASFGNGEVASAFLDVSSLVIPESPVGSIAMIIASIGALAGYVSLRHFHHSNHKIK